MFPKSVEIVEVGPREGFQFEGIGRPEAIAFADKLRLIEALSLTGVRTIQVASFVHPGRVPQMADAERLAAALKPRQGVAYTGIFLNDAGLRRALACTDKLSLVPELMLSASAAFAERNQNRSPAEDVEAQRRMAVTFRDHGLAVRTGSIMAAFGCNYEGAIPLQRVLNLIETLTELAAESGGALTTVNLADTMGWANPEQIRRTIVAMREAWPQLRIGLHLHDTRGLAVANVYAALGEGVDRFDAAVGGLGGCPFAGHRGAAGNVASEEVVFLCRELGIATDIDLDRLVDAARLAEEVVGHPLPSRLIRSSLYPLAAAPSISKTKA